MLSQVAGFAVCVRVMKFACIPHTQIPGSSRIFLDLLYHYDRVQDLYAHPPTLEGIEQAAGRIDYPDERRAEVVAALRAQNTDTGAAVEANLDKLAQPGTVVIATGQQVGLLGGPAFATYKALTAVRYAAALEERGIPAVPVFWLATEDHDLDEVSVAALLDRNSHEMDMRVSSDAAPGAPAGPAPVRGLSLEDLRAAVEGMDFSAETLAIAEAAYGGEPTFGDGFKALWRKLFADRGLILLDPLDPALRRVASPVLRQALDERAEVAADLAERGADLEARGYHQQVAAPADGVLLFRFENGKRTPLRYESGAYKAGRHSYTHAELQALLESEPEQFSPNALLRPVVQDFLLPTAALIGGPAELAYWAQSAVLYDRLLGRMPAALHRASFTLLDSRSSKLLAKYGLTLRDCMTYEAELRQRMAAHLTPPDLSAQFERQGKAVDRALADLRGSLEAFDPTLVEALDRSARKIRYQFEKIQGKTSREIMRRDERSSDDADRLIAWLYPHRGQQERRYSILSFQARFGERLYAEIYDAIRPECADHQALVI
ncbi:MAG: bacillithiol biosynthesis cysteine-adding enzyme BshC [Acidobacteria bacterium]|nr:bacillithiol biosynthesis cysteine-adding enzyme BshC [Acidobacteriota bacterium]